MRNGRLAGLLACVMAGALMLPTSVRAADETAPMDNPQLAAALSDENLLAAAEKTNDGKTLLGLARFAGMAQEGVMVKQSDGSIGVAPPEGLKTRAKILAKVAQVSPEDTAAAAALACWYMHPDARDVQRFLEEDPANGAPHYLRAGLLLGEGRTPEGLAEFREGLARERFTVYDTPSYRQGMTSALDLLGISGETRLAALVKAYEARIDPRGDSIYISLVRLSTKLREVAGTTSAEERGRLVQEMTRLSGKLMGENGLRDEGLNAGRAVLREALIVEAEGTADADAKRALDVAAWAAMAAGWRDSVSADFVSALSAACREPLAKQHKVYYDNLPETEKSRMDEALRAQREASSALIALLAANPDELVGRAVIHDAFTAFHGVKYEHAQVAEAAERVLAAKEAALNLLEELSGAMRSRETMSKLGLSFIMYAYDHEDALPPDLATLKEKGYVVNGAALDSPATGRRYVYTAPGMSLRGRNAGATAILYDDMQLEGDRRLVLFGDGHIVALPKGMLDKMLQEQ